MSYSPTFERFLEQDPNSAGLYNDGANLYQLERSNPVSKLDPLGLENSPTTKPSYTPRPPGFQGPWPGEAYDEPPPPSTTFQFVGHVKVDGKANTRRYVFQVKSQGDVGRMQIIVRQNGNTVNASFPTQVTGQGRNVMDTPDANGMIYVDVTWLGPGGVDVIVRPTNGPGEQVIPVDGGYTPPATTGQR